MKGTMRAARFHGAGRPLVIEDIAPPEPAPGEVLVKVAACGFCHTDLHYLDHGVATAKTPPITLGHEISGMVVRNGHGTGTLKEKEHVLLPAVLPCGRCTLCRQGRENICTSMRMYGNHVDGGFAEYVTVPEKDAIRLHPDMPLADSCIIADALSTPYHAVVNRAKVRSGETVAVVGCGGVGMNAVQFARASGAQVIAIDRDPRKLERALRLGAIETVDASTTQDVGKAVKRLTDGGVDVAIEAVGTPETIDTAFSTMRRGGRMCMIGYSSKPATLPAARMMFFEHSIVGSLGCRPVDYPRIIEMVRRGLVNLDMLITDRMPLERIETAADNLRHGVGLRTIIIP